MTQSWRATAAQLWAHPRSTVMRLLWRGIQALLAAQLAVIGVLIGIDAWRKRSRSQGSFPRKRPVPEDVAESEVLVYTYGEDLFAAMLDAIDRATTSVMFETFIWKGDLVGQQFKHALDRAARRGVAVYVIYDVFANLVVPRAFKRFRPSIHVLRYPLLHWPFNPFSIATYARDHRKIMVVDGETAFVGGYNIGAAYATEWRDTHARITGPSAWELENAFVDFWNAQRKRGQPIIPGTGTPTWEPRVSVHRNDPSALIFPIRTMYLEALDRARHYIYITHAYFIPDRVVLEALLAAAARGVDVRIILPAYSNHIVADWLAHGYYEQCLRAGIKLLLYQNAMVHAKTATIDGVWTTIGTANLDRLSMVGNFEVNVEFYDAGVAEHMEQVFITDSSNTRELTLAEWQRRSAFDKLSELVLWPLRPLL